MAQAEVEEDQYRLYIGRPFSTHETYLEFLEGYNKKKRQLFTYKSGVLVKNARRIKRALDPKIKYYKAKYTCKGGIKRKTQSTGQRSSRY